MDDSEPVGVHDEGTSRRRQPTGTDPLSMALGRLPGLIGVQVEELDTEYDLDVLKELATIVTDQAGGFLERSTSGAR